MGNAKIKVVGVIVCVVCLVALVVWLRGGPDKTGPLEAQQGPGSLVAAESKPLVDANQVVVTVNGTAITEGKVRQALQQQMAQMGGRSGIPPEMMEQLGAQFRSQIVDGLIAEQLLVERVKDSNMAPTETQVMDQIKTIAAGQEPAVSVDEFKTVLAQRGYDFNDVVQQIGREMGIQKLLLTQCEAKVSVSDADANSYYAENSEEFDVPEQVKVSHILIAPETMTPGTDPNQAKVAARTKAEGLLAEVKGGKDFAELAKAHSACPSSADGGDLGFIERGKAVAPFEEAAFALDVGSLSGVVETEFGYHILKVTERKPARRLPFAEAKDQIVAKLREERNRDVVTAYISDLKAKATITYPVTPTAVQ